MTTAQATATIKGGLYETAGLQEQSTFPTGNAFRRNVAKGLGRPTLASIREIWATLTGAASGGAAAASHSRVEANEELGGPRTVETITDVARNTTADDITEITNDFLIYQSYDNTPVPNLDGNPLGTR